MPRLLSGVLFSTAIAGVAYRRGSLSRGGAAGAVLVGTTTFLAGGARWSGILLTFFASSSALSRLEERSSTGKQIAAFTQRGAKRDIVQALANGGVASAVALVHLIRPKPTLLGAFTGAYAAATADTWATEIGALSPTPPRDILTGALVPPGTSGGVTAAGLAGAALGSLLISAVAQTAQAGAGQLWGGLATTLAGVAGSLADSVAGATIQASYFCPACNKPTERRIHDCGVTTQLVRGQAWCTNDVVNVLCTLTGAVVGAVLTWDATGLQLHPDGRDAWLADAESASSTA